MDLRQRSDREPDLERDGHPQRANVTAVNMGYNGNLGAGASATFGFIGSWSGTNAIPAVTCTAT